MSRSIISFRSLAAAALSAAALATTIPALAKSCAAGRQTPQTFSIPAG